MPTTRVRCGGAVQAGGRVGVWSRRGAALHGSRARPRAAEHGAGQKPRHSQSAAAVPTSLLLGSWASSRLPRAPPRVPPTARAPLCCLPAEAMTAQLDSLIGRSIELAAKLQAFDMAVSADRCARCAAQLHALFRAGPASVGCRRCVGNRREDGRAAAFGFLQRHAAAPSHRVLASFRYAAAVPPAVGRSPTWPSQEGVHLPRPSHSMLLVHNSPACLTPLPPPLPAGPTSLRPSCAASGARATAMWQWAVQRASSWPTSSEGGAQVAPNCSVAERA